MKPEKITFSTLFLLLAVMLMALPFLTTLEDILTRIVMGVGWYRQIQEVIVPYEMRIVTALLNLFQLHAQAGNAYIQLDQHGHKEVIYLIWNCVGWQSFVLFFLTLFTGLAGKFTVSSKLQALAIGLLGTYLINIARLVLVMVIYGLLGRGIGIVFHDYFSGLLSISWLFGFWYISYSWVLEEK